MSFLRAGFAGELSLILCLFVYGAPGALFPFHGARQQALGAAV